MARKSESGIDWDLERQLSLQGYSYYDTEHSTLLPADDENSAYTTGDTDSAFERPSSAGRGRRVERIPAEGLINRQLQSVNISSEVSERHSTAIRGGRELPQSNSSGRQASSSDYESSYFTWQDALEEQKMASLAKRPTPSKPATESDQSYLGYNVPVVPPRPPQNVPRQEVRATAWKSPAVEPQTDYRCSDAGIPSSNAPRGTPHLPFPKVPERKKPVAKGPLTIAKDTVGRLPPEPKNGDDIIQIAVVLPSGKRIRRRFRISDSLTLLQHFISSIQEVPNDFEVGTNCPRRILQCVPTPTNPHVYTFEQAGITRNEALFVELPKPGSVSRNLVNHSMAQPGPHSQVQRIPPRRILVTGAGAGGGRSRIHSLPTRRPSSGG